MARRAKKNATPNQSIMLKMAGKSSDVTRGLMGCRKIEGMLENQIYTTLNRHQQILQLRVTKEKSAKNKTRVGGKAVLLKKKEKNCSSSLDDEI